MGSNPTFGTIALWMPSVGKVKEGGDYQAWWLEEGARPGWGCGPPSLSSICMAGMLEQRLAGAAGFGQVQLWKGVWGCH